MFKEVCCCSWWCSLCSLAKSQAIKKISSKCDLLFFIGEKDESGSQKMLCLESAKLFFGYGPKLCYDVWILYATPSTDSTPTSSQYVSIVASFLLATKSSYCLLTYTRESAVVQITEENWKDKVPFLVPVLDVLSWLPLIWTSLLYKVGSIILYFKFFHWFSVLMILGIVALNAIGGYILDRHLGRITANHRVSTWTEDLPMSGRKAFFRSFDNLFISFSNLFVISRPFNTLRKFLPNLISSRKLIFDSNT